MNWITDIVLHMKFKFLKFRYCTYFYHFQNSFKTFFKNIQNNFFQLLRHKNTIKKKVRHLHYCISIKNNDSIVCLQKLKIAFWFLTWQNLVFKKIIFVAFYELFHFKLVRFSNRNKRFHKKTQKTKQNKKTLVLPSVLF